MKLKNLPPPAKVNPLGKKPVVFSQDFLRSLRRNAIFKTIQVDMFAVGLGAAVLLQFALEDESVVTVLADGGVGPHHRATQVLGSLREAFSSFRDGRNCRIDLIVGTHYDGDHLKGLIPIVLDKSIEIGEIWLPPVKNGPNDDNIGSDDFLAGLLFDDQTLRVLRSFLEDKALEVNELARRELVAYTRKLYNGRLSSEYMRSDLPSYRHIGPHPEMSIRPDASNAERVEAYVAFFLKHLRDVTARTGAYPTHESAKYDSYHYRDIRDLAKAALENSGFRQGQGEEFLDSAMQSEQARFLPVALAKIRKSVAESAITASHLNELIEALRIRGIRPQSHFLTSDRPSLFAWKPSEGKFVQHKEGHKEDLELTLLGPTEELIDKHYDKLPIISYEMALGQVLAPVELAEITPNNILSYIFVLELSGQRILISGDAGCYGFSHNGKYREELLRSLAPLDVIQVAHHAGHNYDFYNALLKANFVREGKLAYLLVSHGLRGRYNPSPLFEEFIDRLAWESISLLFTAAPKFSKVQSYYKLIHAVAPDEAEADEGDIRLEFLKSGWYVNRHAVRVSP